MAGFYKKEVKPKFKTMAKLNSLKDLFDDQLRVLYYSEKSFNNVLHAVINMIHSESLRNELQNQADSAIDQVKKLEKLFGKAGIEKEAKTCTAMDGILDELKEVMNADADPIVKDAALIAEVQKAIHFKIACYGTLKTYAGMLDLNEVADRLRETVVEEKEFDRNLSEIAESVNQEAI